MYHVTTFKARKVVTWYIGYMHDVKYFQVTWYIGYAWRQVYPMYHVTWEYTLYMTWLLDVCGNARPIPRRDILVWHFTNIRSHARRSSTWYNCDSQDLRVNLLVPITKKMVDWDQNASETWVFECISPPSVVWHNWCTTLKRYPIYNCLVCVREYCRWVYVHFTNNVDRYIHL